jgi:hypothetical protein
VELTKLTTAAYRPYTQDEASLLGECGFHFACANGVTPSPEWEAGLKALHNAGVKLICRFPNWGSLGLCDEEHSFRAWDGKSNVVNEGESGRLAGTSYWYPDIDEIALQSLQPLVDMGVDGILISPLPSDRAFTTDWYGFDGHPKYTTAYWSFDAHAQRAWRAVSDFPMPTHAEPGPDGGPPTGDLLVFYRWYRGMWINRITRMADAALAAGLKHIGTWYIPLTFWDGENMANASADSVPSLEAWRQHIEAQGGEATFVNACLLGLWERWRVPGMETMRVCNTELGWKSMVGAHSCGPDWHGAILNNGAAAHRLGYSGLFCGEIEMLQPANADRARTTFAQLYDLWDG